MSFSNTLQYIRLVLRIQHFGGPSAAVVAAEGSVAVAGDCNSGQSTGHVHRPVRQNEDFHHGIVVAPTGHGGYLHEPA